MVRVRVMSYNIRALKDDRAAVVRVVRALDPDVLCLQEVPRHPFSGHRISELASDCGMLWAGGGSRGMMSTTLLTSLRLEVLASGHRQFPVRWHDEPRGWGYARVRLPGGAPLTAVSVHLSLRTSEHREHVRLLRDAAETSDPLVVGGDVNETDDGPGWAPLAEGLIDVCGDALTFPALTPARRIDAIFAAAELQPEAVIVEVPEADLCAASDHRPVVVDLCPGAADAPEVDRVR